MSEIMQQLKESTRALHNNAENQEFQRLLASGELSTAAYVQYLEQLFLIHDGLERRLVEAQSTSPAIAKVLTENQLQVPFLERDLAFFKAATKPAAATKSTAWILEQIDGFAAKHPVALLGAHYVLLGSKHGGKFIAHNLATKYKLDEGCGVLYFNPYGTNFQQIWKDFAAAFNMVALSDDERASVLEAAGMMFEGMGRLSAEMGQMQLN